MNTKLSGQTIGGSGWEKPCKVYDPEKQKLIAEYPSMRKASQMLGIKIQTLRDAHNRRGKTFSRNLNMKVAVR